MFVFFTDELCIVKELWQLRNKILQFNLSVMILFINSFMNKYLPKYLLIKLLMGVRSWENEI